MAVEQARREPAGYEPHNRTCVRDAGAGPGHRFVCTDCQPFVSRKGGQRNALIFIAHGSLGHLTPDEYARQRQISPTAEAASL